MLSKSTAGDSSVWCSISVTRPMSSCQEAPSTRRSSPMRSTWSSQVRVSRCRDAGACAMSVLLFVAAGEEHAALAHFLFDERPDLVQVLEEPRLALEMEGARARDVDVEDGLDAPRPCAHHDDAVGEEDRLVDLVGNEEHRLAGLVPDLEQLLLHELARLRVERGKRLVHQQDLGVGGERAGQVAALLHAARKLVRVGF